MRHDHAPRGSERPLYPVATLDDDYEVKAMEVVRFGGVPLVRTDDGEWRVVDRVDLRGVVDLED